MSKGDLFMMIKQGLFSLLLAICGGNQKVKKNRAK